MRAWNALPAFLPVDPATPVCEKMYPSFTALAVTPGAGLACAPAPVVARPTAASPADATQAMPRTSAPRRVTDLVPAMKTPLVTAARDGRGAARGVAPAGSSPTSVAA